MITYSEAALLLKDVDYLPDWNLKWKLVDSDWVGWAYMQWTFTDAEGLQECRKWLIDLHEATPSDIIQTALRAALDAAEHEVREQFKYKDRKIYGPHFDPDSLAEFAKYKANLSLKEPTQHKCPDCDGKGTIQAWPHTTCTECKGSGWINLSLT